MPRGCITSEQRIGTGIGEALARITAGIENIMEDIKADLARGLRTP
uniref:Cys/Met metabolism PLP-dependent enzyme n=1 Tax=Candidatus Kentrum sp. DK TaxID=2126562 RepID=A0A450S065_9GAMM|nr:MAG: Cys/Met metabolism PLP-dependent enzyme [Candidatus Kentron sp. DK]VFJ44928.1 MAG: Cys/Met metabolism PLP-dependent enzyme [Candidatus Kentron sp. DK]